MSYDFTVLHIQVQVINITNLRHYTTYLHNSMCVIIPAWTAYTARHSDYSIYTLDAVMPYDFDIVHILV
jgi:hypothetical protein